MMATKSKHAMNARDKIKPKSIRVAILSALADGAITTIDDLQTTLDVPRKTVVDNAVHAANDNLIKRMRDDVTKLAAYQITATGREYLKMYANSNAVEPSLPEVPVCEESQSPEVCGEPVPDLSAGILNRVRAEALRKARDIFNGSIAYNFVAADGYSCALDIASELEYMAADMEAGKC